MVIEIEGQVLEYVKTEKHIEVEVLLHVNDFDRLCESEQRPFCLIVNACPIATINSAHPEPKAGKKAAVGLFTVNACNLLVSYADKLLIQD